MSINATATISINYTKIPLFPCVIIAERGDGG